jgi:hypothetical protein
MVEETKEIPREMFPDISIEAELKKSYDAPFLRCGN